MSTTHQEAVRTEKAVLDGITRAIWADVWIMEQEERAERTGRRVPWPPGSQILDYLPKTIPASIKQRAKDFAAVLRHQNRTNLYGLFLQAEAAPGKHRREPTPFDFGFDLAMQGMGHGVSWFDDHPEFEIKIPHFENYGR